MAAEIQAIIDGFSFGKKEIAGKFRILSDSIDTIYSFRMDDTYRGLEDPLITKAHGYLKDHSVNGVWYYRRASDTMSHNMAKMAITSPHPRA